MYWWRLSAAIAAVTFCLSGGGACAQSANGSPQAVTQTDLAGLAKISASISPAEKARATAVFATAFGLWKAGDFDAAALGFKQGLTLDPANPLANYYYGDCLMRRKAKSDARTYLSRAVAFGGVTAEALKAQAELDQLSLAPTELSEMNADEISSALDGDWTVSAEGSHYKFKIEKDKTGAEKISGRNTWLLGQVVFKNLEISGDKISFIATDFGIPNQNYEGRLSGNGRIEGDWSYNGYKGKFSAKRQ